MEQAEKSQNSPNPWWSCLWASLVVIALVLGVAALWMPLERHLKIEEILEEIRVKHERMDKLINMIRLIEYTF